MNKTILALSAAICLGLSGTAFAAAHTGAPMKAASGSMSAPATGSMAPTSKAEAKAMMKQSEGDYKAAKARCKPLKGAEGRACKKEAKATHEKAEADIRRAKADMKAAAKKS
ncbi:MAG: hypothetical protein ABIU58_00935 [Ramlibacter sp.]